MRTTQPTPPPPPSTRSNLHSTRREGLIISVVIGVAIVAVIAVAMIVSSGDDPSTPDANGLGAAPPTASSTATATTVAPETTTQVQTAPGGGGGVVPIEPTSTTPAAVPADTVVPNTPDTSEQAPPPTADDGAGEGAPGGDSGEAPGSSAEGYIAVGEELSPWDNEHPALANLDQNLLAAVQLAAADAEAEGILLVITSGWRSENYQQRLLDEAIVTYGSEEEARKWVLGPEESTHVFGKAVDIGYTDADYWMIERGSAYGLCQTYANEIWHFELTVEPGGTCPAPIEDASHR